MAANHVINSWHIVQSFISSQECHLQAIKIKGLLYTTNGTISFFADHLNTISATCFLLSHSPYLYLPRTLEIMQIHEDLSEIEIIYCLPLLLACFTRGANTYANSNKTSWGRPWKSASEDGRQFLTTTSSIGPPILCKLSLSSLSQPRISLL